MSCKSGIYVTNTTQGTSIANGGIYAPTSIVRRYGQLVNLSGDGVNIGSEGGCLNGSGYYEIIAIPTVEVTAAGDVTASLYQDGVAIPGAVSSVTADAAGDKVVLPLAALARVRCACDLSNITVVISGQAVTSYNLSICIEKV